MWERPKRAARGDDDNERIWREVGFALSQWEQMESTVAILFGTLMEAEYRAATMVFGTLNSNNAKTNALAAAAEVFFAQHKVDDDYKKQFDLLLRHYYGASQRRNDIAHASVVGFDEGAYLVPPQYSPKGPFRNSEAVDKVLKQAGSYAYVADDIEFLTGLFIDLGHYVYTFYEAVYEVLDSCPNPRP